MLLDDLYSCIEEYEKLTGSKPKTIQMNIMDCHEIFGTTEGKTILGMEATLKSSPRNQVAFDVIESVPKDGLVAGIRYDFGPALEIIEDPSLSDIPHESEAKSISISYEHFPGYGTVFKVQRFYESMDKVNYGIPNAK